MAPDTASPLLQQPARSHSLPTPHPPIHTHLPCETSWKAGLLWTPSPQPHAPENWRGNRFPSPPPDAQLSLPLCLCPAQRFSCTQTCSSLPTLLRPRAAQVGVGLGGGCPWLPLLIPPQPPRRGQAHCTGVSVLRPGPPIRLWEAGPVPYLQRCKSVSRCASGDGPARPGINSLLSDSGKVLPLSRCHNFLSPLIKQKA